MKDLLNKVKTKFEDVMFVEVPLSAEERIKKIDEKTLSRIADKADEVLVVKANSKEEFEEQVNELLKIRKAFNSYSEVTVEEKKPTKQISEGAWKFWATVVGNVTSGAVVIYSTLYSDEGNFINDFTRKVINKRIDGDKF